MGLKKKMFLGWVAIEIAALPLALPAVAGLTHNVSFSVQPQVHASELSPQPGKTRFLVASNAHFAVLSEGVIGELTTTITRSGQVDGLSFGSKAQTHGSAGACNMPNTTKQSRIFTSFSKTAASRGTRQEQSVLVEVSYDPSLSPQISIVTVQQAHSQGALLAFPCDTVFS